MGSVSYSFEKVCFICLTSCVSMSFLLEHSYEDGLRFVERKPLLIDEESDGTRGLSENESEAEDNSPFFGGNISRM